MALKLGLGWWMRSAERRWSKVGVDVSETRSRQARVGTSVNKRKKTLTELELGKSGISLDSVRATSELSAGYIPSSHLFIVRVTVKSPR